MKEQLHKIVYSTNPNLNLEDKVEEATTLLPDKQTLKVQLDKKQRAGKVVTLVTGFVGKQEDLDALTKFLKAKCGVGGSNKDGTIIIQGNFLDKVTMLLQQQGYVKTKRIGG